MRLINIQKEVFETLQSPKTHSPSERRRAYLFAAVYGIAVVSFFLCWFHFVGAWVAHMAVQLVELIFTIMYALTINEYLEKHHTALECERTANPIVDAYFGVRVTQVLLFMWTRNWFCAVLFAAALGGAVLGLRRGNVYVDATELWRTARSSEKNSWGVLVAEALLFVVALVTMVFSIIFHYT